MTTAPHHPTPSLVGWLLHWRVLVVARREYLATVKTKAFFAALLLMPILSAAAVAVPWIANNAAAEQVRQFVVLDRSGQLLSGLRQAAKERDAQFSQGRKSERFELIAEAPESTLTEQRLSLSERVRSGELFAFLEIAPDILSAAPARSGGSITGVVRYYSNTPTHRDLRRWLETVIGEEVARLKLQQQGIDIASVERAQTPVSIEETSLLVEQDGSIKATAAPDPIRDLGFPVIAVMTMFTAVMLGAGPLMQSALEEKMQRIAEVLVSSVSPLQLMLGKLLGAAGVSYTLLFIYLGGGALLASQFGDVPLLTLKTAAAMAVFQSIALMMYGAIFLAVGSACNDLRSSQSLMMPVMIVVTAPLLLLQLVLTDPNSSVATALSLFPFFTPVLMMLRVTLPPGAPWSEVWLGFSLSALTAIACLYAASRVFRVGMLMQGAAPSYRELWRWIKNG